MNVCMKIDFVLAVFCCIYSCIRGIHSVKQHVSQSGPLTHTLEDEAGRLFVGGRNIIMRFSHDLVLEEKVSTKTSFNCSGNDCNKEFEGNDISIFIFYPDKTGTYILLCGTSDYGSCALYNKTNFKDNIKLDQYDPGESVDHCLGSRTSAVALAVPVNRGNRKEIEIFSAMDYDGRTKEKFPKVFSVRRITEFEQDIILHYASAYPDEYITLKDDLFNESLFDFKYGFHYNGYTYFLRNTKHKNPRSQISEICSDDHNYRSYVESEISCDGLRFIKSAFMLKNDNKAFLYIAFSSFNYRGTAICGYSMVNLRLKFRKIQEDCFYNKRGSTPEWISGTEKSCQQTLQPGTDFTCGRLANNARIKSVSSIEINLIGTDNRIMTSLIAAIEDDATMLYTGFADGTITKFLKTSSNLLALFSVNVTSESKINDRMVLSPTSERLYLTYANKVVMMRTDNCTLHSTCVGCLSDAVSCHWCADSSNGGKCINADDNSCTITRKDFCDPEILSVTPLSGPTAGGTRLNFTGQFGDPANSVYTVKVGRECILKDRTGERISCVTLEAAAPEDTEIKLEVNFHGTENHTRPVPLTGSTTYSGKYAYREPKLVKIEPQRSSSRGRPILLLSGTHLDIGAEGKCDVSGSSCDIISKTATEVIIAMKEQERAIGTRTINYKIDNATISADVEIIQQPVIDAVLPSRVIQSGGLTLTVIGSRLDGMGKFIEADFLCDGTNLSCVDRTLKAISECQIKNETTMLCRTPPVKARTLPVNVQFSVVNRFGPVNASAEPMLTVVEDPTVDNLTEPLIFTDNYILLEIKGSNFTYVDMTEIKVTVGRVDCVVSDVTDDVISCGATIPPDVLFNRDFVQVQIGNIIRTIGQAVYRPPSRQTAPQYPVTKAGTNPSVVILSVIAGIVFMTVIVVLGMKRLRLGPFKLRPDEQFNVVFRNGGSDVLTLDGLSENHATDISQNRQNAYQEQTFRKPTSDENYDTCTEALLPAVDEDMKLTLERQRLIIDRDSIILGEILGQGHFGCVYKGYLQTPGEKEEQVVAAKTLHRKNPKDLDINMFLKEALIMKDFQHRYVMKLIGICIGHDQLPLVILPYMKHGDLLTYLRDAKNVPTVKDLVTFGVDIANGMCYLAELKFVHRDLAARNCMMDDEYHVKVADFGLSRDVYEKEYYSSCDKTTKLPVKWMAPESLEFGMYNSKSDVWSYGVVLWELLTRGVNPYPEVDNWDILKYLKTGRRMSQPSFCPEEMFSIMRRCWSWEPVERPSFGELTVEIPALIRQLEHPAGEKGGKINIETTYVNFMASSTNT